jgi:hypothetical protein
MLMKKCKCTDMNWRSMKLLEFKEKVWRQWHIIKENEGINSYWKIVNKLTRTQGAEGTVK